VTRSLTRQFNVCLARRLDHRVSKCSFCTYTCAALFRCSCSNLARLFIFQGLTDPVADSSDSDEEVDNKDELDEKAPVSDGVGKSWYLPGGRDFDLTGALFGKWTAAYALYGFARGGVVVPSRVDELYKMQLKYVFDVHCCCFATFVFSLLLTLVLHLDLCRRWHERILSAMVSP
jgi:hypothetical protein